MTRASTTITVAMPHTIPNANSRRLNVGRPSSSGAPPVNRHSFPSNCDSDSTAPKTIAIALMTRVVYRADAAASATAPSTIGMAR